MSNFRLLGLICVLCISVSFEFKCDFHEEGERGDKKYYCTVKTVEKHLQHKEDYNVKNFVLEGQPTHISELEYPFCMRFESLEKISITGVKKIDGNILSKCKSLITLEIISALIEELPEKLLQSNTELHYLTVKNTRLRTLPENFFVNNKYLWQIFLDNNQITSLPPSILKTHSYLDQLSLKNNKLKELNPTWFEDLSGLDHLYLNHNEISELPKNVFVHLSSLYDLHMSDNQLTTIHADSFRTFTGYIGGLDIVDFENNQINAIDKKFIENSRIKNLKMAGNICNTSSDEEEEVDENDLSICFKNYKPRE